MSSMRWAGVLSILLILLILSAGCGQRLPRGQTTNNTTVWGRPAPRAYAGPDGSDVPTTGTVPATTAPVTPGAVVPATIIPSTSSTITVTPTYRNPPPHIDITANYTVVFDETFIFSWNATALTYELKNAPLLIDYTLDVPDITRTRIARDPVSGNDLTVTSIYPDPDARFEITVRDPVTKRIFDQDGYGGQYDVSIKKQLQIRYPGTYHIQMEGRRVTAHVKFTVPKTEET